MDNILEDYRKEQQEKAQTDYQIGCLQRAIGDAYRNGDTKEYYRILKELSAYGDDLICYKSDPKLWNRFISENGKTSKAYTIKEIKDGVGEIFHVT